MKTRTLLSMRFGHWHVTLEHNASDLCLWVGAYYTDREVWLCLVPCFPIHVRRVP